MDDWTDYEEDDGNGDAGRLLDLRYDEEMGNLFDSILSDVDVPMVSHFTFMFTISRYGSIDGCGRRI